MIHVELYYELKEPGFAISHRPDGEDITTRGIDLLGLSTGARLRLKDAVVELTGLRSPCG